MVNVYTTLSFSHFPLRHVYVDQKSKQCECHVETFYLFFFIGISYVTLDSSPKSMERVYGKKKCVSPYLKTIKSYMVVPTLKRLHKYDSGLQVTGFPDSFGIHQKAHCRKVLWTLGMCKICMC